MRLPGHCTRCGRTGPYVTVDPGRGMLGLAIAGVAEGICDQCADELDDERRASHGLPPSSARRLPRNPRRTFGRTGGHS